MNVMFASGGYPWTVVPLERHNDFMAAFDSGSFGEDIEPFAKLLAWLMGKKK